MTTTLLAVDDSKTMRRVLEITFAGEDYRVVLAESTDDALAKARSEHPAVALVDARVGDANGYDLAQRLKSDSPGTRVIILSSKHQPYDKGRGTAAGVDDFIDKPFDTQQLIDKVAAVARQAGPFAGEGVPAAAQAPYRSAPQAVPQPATPQFAQQRSRAPTLAYGSQPPSPEPVQPQQRAATLPGTPAAPPMAPIAPTPVTGVPLQREAPAPAQAPRPAVPAAVPAAGVAGGNGQQFAQRLEALGLDKSQVEGVLALSREVIEQVVWEVVPQLAETMIQEEIRRLTTE